MTHLHITKKEERNETPTTYKTQTFEYQSMHYQNAFLFVQIEHVYIPLPTIPFFQIIGYPSIKVFRRGNEEVDYWGQNNVEDIKNFVEKTVLRKEDEL